jgi:hypothetical protein
MQHRRLRVSILNLGFLNPATRRRRPGSDCDDTVDFRLGRFIAQVQESPLDVEQDSARVQNFMTQLEATFRTSPLWRGSGPEEVQAASEVRTQTHTTCRFRRTPQT